jgi:hypothetical protein
MSLVAGDGCMPASGRALDAAADDIRQTCSWGVSSFMTLHERYGCEMHTHVDVLKATGIRSCPFQEQHAHTHTHKHACAVLLCGWPPHIPPSHHPLLSRLEPASSQPIPSPPQQYATNVLSQLQARGDFAARGPKGCGAACEPCTKLSTIGRYTIILFSQAWCHIAISWSQNHMHGPESHQRCQAEADEHAEAAEHAPG